MDSTNTNGTEFCRTSPKILHWLVKQYRKWTYLLKSTGIKTQWQDILLQYNDTIMYAVYTPQAFVVHINEAKINRDRISWYLLLLIWSSWLPSPWLKSHFWLKKGSLKVWCCHPYAALWVWCSSGLLLWFSMYVVSPWTCHFNRSV